MRDVEIQVQSLGNLLAGILSVARSTKRFAGSFYLEGDTVFTVDLGTHRIYG